MYYGGGMFIGGGVILGTGIGLLLDEPGAGALIGLGGGMILAAMAQVPGRLLGKVAEYEAFEDRLKRKRAESQDD